MSRAIPSHSTINSAPQKMGAVECIRGLACLMVLLSHLSLTFYPALHNFSQQDLQQQPVQAMIHYSPFGFLYSGTAAVFIFFVLSGYILSYVACRREDVSQRVLRMSIKRYPRLMIPACISCLIAFYLLTQWRVDTSELSTWVNQYRLTPDQSWLDALYTGVVTVFTQTGINPYNPVLWTMKVELIGSLLVFLLVVIRVQGRYQYWGYIIDTLMLLSCALLLASHWLVAQFSYGLIGFLLGYLSFFYGRNISIRIASVLLAVGLYLAGYHADSALYQWLAVILPQDTYVVANFLAAPCVVYAVLFNQQFKTACTNGFTLWLGKVSFSVYLLHMSLLVTLSAFIFNILFQQGASYHMAAIVSILCSIPLIYLIAWGFYQLIDRTSLSVSQHLASWLLKK